MIVFIIIFMFSALSVNAQEQMRYVAAKNGLLIRIDPNLEGAVIGSVKFNQEVFIEDELYLDTIEYRIAYWQRIRCDSSNVSGYVFGGYLNQEKLPEREFSSLRMLLWQIIENLETKYEIEHLDDPAMKFDENIHIQGGKNHLLIHKYGYEWKAIELNLFNWELYEVINLIELATWFGKDEEYQEFVRSIQLGKLDEFKWINAFDDPEGEMILEKRHPRGVRIIESSSL